MLKNEYINCPFCKTGDFDLIGLKHHLESRYCEVYNNVPEDGTIEQRLSDLKHKYEREKELE